MCFPSLSILHRANNTTQQPRISAAPEPRISQSVDALEASVSLPPGFQLKRNQHGNMPQILLLQSYGMWWPLHSSLWPWMLAVWTLHTGIHLYPYRSISDEVQLSIQSSFPLQPHKGWRDPVSSHCMFKIEAENPPKKTHQMMLSPARTLGEFCILVVREK